MSDAKKPTPVRPIGPAPNVDIIPVKSAMTRGIDFFVVHRSFGNGPTKRHRLSCVGHEVDGAPPTMGWMEDVEDVFFNPMVQPAFRVARESAQKLIDALWDCGLRPTEGSGSAGSLAATEKHLQDMRVIAFKKLGIGGDR